VQLRVHLLRLDFTAEVGKKIVLYKAVTMDNKQRELTVRVAAAGVFVGCRRQSLFSG